MGLPITNISPRMVKLLLVSETTFMNDSLKLCHHNEIQTHLTQPDDDFFPPSILLVHYMFPPTLFQESEDNTVKRFCSIIHGRFSTGRVQPSLVVTISNGSSILPHFPLGGHHHHHLLSPDVLNTSASIRRLSVPEFPKKDEEQPLFTSFNDS